MAGPALRHQPGRSGRRAHFGLAGSVALPQDALFATVRVRSAGDPLAARDASVNAAADEQPLEVLLSGQESFRLYLPVVQIPFRLYLPVVTRR